jgi:hypothetical protein
MARATRRQQPYRKGLGTRLPGAVKDAMTRGRTAGGLNPMDNKRALLAGKMQKIKIPNPLKAADKIWGAAAGPTNWPKNPPMGDAGPPIRIAGTKRKRVKGRKPYER